MSGSGAAASSASRLGSAGPNTSASRGVGVSACKLRSAAAGSAKPSRLSSRRTARSSGAAVRRSLTGPRGLSAIRVSADWGSAGAISGPRIRKSLTDLDRREPTGRLPLRARPLTLPSPRRGEGECSYRGLALLAGADANGLAEGEHEDLAVADGAGLGGAADHRDHFVRQVVGHHDLHLDLGQEIDR